MEIERKPISLTKPGNRLLDYQAFEDEYRLTNSPDDNFNCKASAYRTSFPIICSPDETANSQNDYENGLISTINKSKFDLQSAANFLTGINIVFLLLYLVPKLHRPDESTAFVHVVLSLIISVLSGLFVFIKPAVVDKKSLSRLRILALTQFLMATVMAVLSSLLY